MTAAPPPERPRLGAQGQIYVTLAAARQYLEAVDVPGDIETARRELTELMLDARQNPDDPGAYRARSHATGLDLSARVSVEGRLHVVVHVSVRERGPRGPRPRRVVGPR